MALPPQKRPPLWTPVSTALSPATASACRQVPRSARCVLQPEAGRAGDDQLPDPVWEQVLGWLDAPELAASRQVCRQWDRVARHPGLQTRSFRRGFAPADRQRLQQGLEGGQARQALLDWCGQLASDAPARQRLQRLACGHPQVWRLFHALVQERIETRSFAERSPDPVLCPRHYFLRLVCSPDGRWLAGEAKGPGFSGVTVSIWYDDRQSLQQAGQFVCDRGLRSLLFSTDSLLQAIDKSGRLHSWQRLDPHVWQRQTARVLYQCPYLEDVCHSPDRCCMAVSLACARLVIAARTAAGDWEPEFSWQWPDAAMHPDAPDYHYLDAISFVGFSADGRTLAFSVPSIARRQVHICQRTDAGWQWHALETGTARLDSCVLAPGGRWLAKACRPGTDPVFFGEVTLQLWRCGTDTVWQCVSQIACDCAHRPFVMAFSPDDRHLAFLRGEYTAPGLCILSSAGRDAPAGPLLSDTLSLPARGTGPGHSPALRFGPDSRYLVVTDVPCAGQLILLREDRERGWITLCSLADQVERPLWNIQGAAAVFSPDGQHCVFLTQNQCSLWGRYSDRLQGNSYRCKLPLAERGVLSNFLFAPDGSRLWITLFPDPADPEDNIRLSCLPLLPAGVS